MITKSDTQEKHSCWSRCAVSTGIINRIKVICEIKVLHTVLNILSECFEDIHGGGVVGGAPRMRDRFLWSSGGLHSRLAGRRLTS